MDIISLKMLKKKLSQISERLYNTDNDDAISESYELDKTIDDIDSWIDHLDNKNV